MRLTWGTLCFLAVLWSVTPSLAAQTLHLVAAKADLEGPDLHIATATPESAAAIPGTASGGQYVTGFRDSANHVVFTVPVGETDIYDLRIGYRSNAHRGYADPQAIKRGSMTATGTLASRAP